MSQRLSSSPPVGKFVSLKGKAPPGPVAAKIPATREDRTVKNVLPWMKSGRHFLVYFAGLGGAWIVFLSVIGMALGHWVPKHDEAGAKIHEALQAVVPAQHLQLIQEVPRPLDAVTLEPAANEPMPAVGPLEETRADVAELAHPGCQDGACRKERFSSEVKERLLRPDEVKEAKPQPLPGTKIVFTNDPPTAFRQAALDKKLVFMIHLSGNFEDQGFT